MIFNLTFEPVRTASGYRYCVRDTDGSVMIERSRVPLHDAARRLAGDGKFGKLVMARYPDSSPCLHGDILRLSKQTIMENEKHGPRVTKFYEFDRVSPDDTP